MRGYPVGTVAFYGPDNLRASKVAVSIIRAEDAEPELNRWFSETGDVRTDMAIQDEIAAWLRQHSVRSIGMRENILRCPHEEGIDYPLGEDCPQCPHWRGRDPWGDDSEQDANTSTMLALLKAKGMLK